MDQQEKGKDPKFIGGEGGGLLNFLCFINKNTDCEKTRKGRI
jgi:hypothetical protein